MESMISMYDVVFMSGIIFGLVAIVKSFGLKKKWLQITSILFGIAMGCVYLSPSLSDIKYGVVAGIIAGFMASG